MSFEELLDSVVRRIMTHQESADADVILSEDALADAERLAEATPERPEALRALGYFFYFRSQARPDESALVDFGLSLRYLAALSSDPDMIPAPVRRVLGPAAEPARQIGIAGEMTGAAVRMAHPVLLDTAIDLYTAAASSNDAGRLSDLGAAYRMRAKRTGSVQDLAAAIETGTQALAVEDSHPNRPGMLSNLSATYQLRYDRTGELTDLDKAIDLSTTALAAVTPEHEEWVGFLSNLGAAHNVRFARTGAKADLDKAIEYGTAAVEAAPEDHPGRSLYQFRLAVAFRLRSVRNGDLADLARAIEVFGDILRTVAHDHPDMPMYQANLASALLNRFERTGSPGDLARSIELYEQSVRGTLPEDPRRSSRLSNLAYAYQCQFERTGRLASLDQAIDLGEQVLASPDVDAFHARYLANLGLAYKSRYGRTRVLADLRRAEQLYEEALEGVSAEDPTRAQLASNLGRVHMNVFERTGEEESLERAIDLHQQALHATAPDHPNRAGYQVNLGAAYVVQFGHNDMIADLDRAIELYEQAIAATPGDVPDRSMYLSNLAIACRNRFERTGIPQDLDRALRAATEAVDTTAVDHPARAGRLATLCRVHLQRDEVDPEVARKLVTEAEQTDTAPPADQARVRFEAGTLAHAAGEHRLAADLLDRAVELLPSLYPRESDWEDQEHTLGQHTGLISEAVAVHCALQEYGEAVRVAEQGRAILLSAQFDLRAGLTSALPDGPVIMVNSGSRRSDAVIIDGGLRHVALPDMKPADVRRHIHTLIEETGGDVDDPERTSRVITEITGWLWDCAVKPILDALPGSDPLPRVWWMPTGLLGLLPLHAAGHVGEPGALDKVVSSYTLTLHTLARLKSGVPTEPRRQLVVTGKEDDGLPGTRAEAEFLHTRFPHMPLLADDQATRQRVLTALQECTWGHFACHAVANAETPSRSGLELADGILSLPQISRLRLDNAELAYLSACSTATPGWQHADEALHIASAFQLAGFRHVIASLWPMNDSVAGQAAEAFYGQVSSADSAARTLHQITLQLRKKRPAHPYLWAPLVHTGR
ncbi:tetratricopeptide (TPR) repeat protein [Kibdelosporangium banguiense]|uniref:Tetratricopeptide (TPR) repeat protein n=1 Tax=Kibdelosporangium banguiense TaxID=1365924 RepID=A0ABS4TQG2_9PSEU|nr:CHAT domain-containing protein [Kibdelosporangium banguiense]MBP2326642.1 tetratricopeptide (TPR) repeat protein [Kibdelosporangium banguiense]